MFKLDLSSTYWWPVKFSVPRETGGSFETFTFEVEFNRLPVDEVDAMFKQAGEDRLPDTALVPRLITGWKGVAARDGAAVPFSPLNLDRALAIAGLGSAIVKAFVESQAQGPAKN